ncbi:MAG: hypothetical protein EZS28_051739, partial [Streblomastix strix]
MQYMENARKRLDAVKTEKQERVTRVLIVNDEKEADRRKNDDRAISIRQQKREAELDESRVTQAKADMRGDLVRRKTDPLAMYDEMKVTEQLYDDIIQSKDNLISELKNQLEDKDHQYMGSLNAQRQDIDNELLIMKETYRELVASQQDELEKLEAQFDKDRSTMLEQFRTEVDSHIDQRRKTEVAQLEAIRQTRDM